MVTAEVDYQVPSAVGEPRGRRSAVSGEPRLASAVTIPFIAMAVKNRPVIQLAGRLTLPARHAKL